MGNICAFSGCRTQRFWCAVLEAADETAAISPRIVRNCMMRRNRYRVGRADLLLAVSDGRETGGTAAVVRMARRAGKEVRLIETGRAALGAEAAFTGGDAVFQMQPAQPQYKNLRR